MAIETAMGRIPITTHKKQQRNVQRATSNDQTLPVVSAPTNHTHRKTWNGYDEKKRAHIEKFINIANTRANIYHETQSTEKLPSFPPVYPPFAKKNEE